MLRLFRKPTRVAVQAVICVLLSGCGVGAAACGEPLQQQQPPTQAQTVSTASGASISTTEFDRAHAAAQRILAGAEFQRDPPTLWDIIKDKIGEALVRLFVGIDRVTSASPWMGRALEWALFIVAAIGLLIWGLRTVQRQRMRIALGGAPLKTAEQAREREDWWRLAEVAAANGAWREAVHAVYWAAIIHLENRRAWRHNASRTPREYVRLLKPGSTEQRELRGLTSALEKSWYGQQETREEEFHSARESFERLTAGDDATAQNARHTGLAGGGA